MIRDFLERRSSISTWTGHEPEDAEEIRLQKTLLVSIAAIIVPFSFMWAAIYYLSGEFVAAAIPFSYGVISSFSILLFAATRATNRRFRLFRFSQLLLILLLPFLLMIVLGGFVNSSAVVLWSLLCPLGALLFANPRQATWWLLAYVTLVVLSGQLQPFVRASNSLPPGLILLFFVLNICTISVIAFVLLRYFIDQKNAFLSLLRVEQEKSESLLLNILPRKVAEILKVEQRLIADQYESATILFVDLVAFTPLTAKLAPAETVALLNEIYSRFDDLAEAHGLEKLKTIGDSYMVVAGVPEPRPDHAQAAAAMALAMADYLATFVMSDGQRLQSRMGLNSGPLVAGVVGRQKFQYDVWGDAVNVASRMESHGLPGKIQLTESTYALLGEEFSCEPRGAIEVRGKGMMETWFLTGGRQGID